MKTICIIGWYGTETIGDRAILAGIISMLGKSFGKFKLILGSLYPTYSERMILEDSKFYEKILGYKLDIEIFDSREKRTLKNMIKKSELLAVGGGPLMHIEPLYMIEFAFDFAQKNKISTALIGCGIGPLFSDEFKRVCIRIIKNSDMIILRDEKSKENIIEIAKELKKDISKKNISVSYDPAVECALSYLDLKEEASLDKKEEYISINFRDFPSEYASNNLRDLINTRLENILIKIAVKYKDIKILLVPMHYFFIGTDDREFLNEIKLKNLNLNNLKVQNSILSLEETMQVFSKAKFNIGMRFHSVVLQTVLSGKNYIFDYTEPKKGKISGFVGDIDKLDFYNKRFINLQEDDLDTVNIDKFFEYNEEKFNFDTSKIKSRLDIYGKELKNLLREV